MLRRTLLTSLIVAIAAAVGVWIRVGDLPDALETHRQPEIALLIDDVKLISMVPGAPEVEAHRSVLVRGERIAEIGAAGSLAAPADAIVVNGQGGTLIPGLIDAHIHLSDEAELAAYLAYGVTGVRNMSGYPFHLTLADRIARGELVGPDFITTGPILNSNGPNEAIIHQIVNTADEARHAVRAQHAAGFRALKIYSNLTREAFEAILDEARLLGMSVTGHSPEGVRSPGVPREVPFDLPWEASVGRGLTTLEHVETLVWHSLRDDLDADRMRQVAARLAASGDVVTPTLIAHKRLVLIAETRGAYLERPGSETINPLVRRFEKGSEEHWSQMDPTGYEAPHAEFFLTATRLLHEAGVPIIAGTDSGGFGLVPGASLADELKLLVDAGLSPYEALAAATRVSARTLGFQRTGVIEPGSRANLVLVKEDPLADIGAVAQPLGVVVGGRWLDRNDLDALQAAAADTSLVRSAWRALRMLLAV